MEAQFYEGKPQQATAGHVLMTYTRGEAVMDERVNAT